MYRNKTAKREKYYEEVIRLHFEKGYGEDRIAKILPIGHTTVGRWIANFVAENKHNPDFNAMRKKKQKAAPREQHKAEHQESSLDDKDEVAKLKSEIEQLRKELDFERLRATAYNTMIDIAEKKSPPWRRRRRKASPLNSSNRSVKKTLASEE